MKLKCADGRRVMILASGKVVHREDGSLCTSKQMRLGSKVVVPSSAAIEALADEAERGYDPQTLIDQPSREHP